MYLDSIVIQELEYMGAQKAQLYSICNNSWRDDVDLTFELLAIQYACQMQILCPLSKLLATTG